MYLEDKNLCPAVEPKPYSLDALIVWLEKQNPNQTYDYHDTHACLFAKAFGLVGYADFHEITAKTFPGAHYIAVNTPWTYGAALERARFIRDKRETVFCIDAPSPLKAMAYSHVSVGVTYSYNAGTAIPTSWPLT